MQIVYCCWLLFETAYVYIFIVETKGLSLEETAALFDGTDAEVYNTGVHAAGAIPESPRDEKDHDFIEKA